MRGATKTSDAQVADVLPGEVTGEQSWRFEASEADFRFAVLHPDIAVALVETPFHFSGTAERACQGELRGVRIAWHPLLTTELAKTQYSVLVKLQAAFSPFCPAWRLDLSAASQYQALQVNVRCYPLFGLWTSLWLRPTQALWFDLLQALVCSLGHAAERLAQGTPEELLGSLASPEQRASLKTYLQSRDSTVRSVTLEGNPAAASLSILDVGDRTLARFRTNLPRPRRGQEAVHVGQAERAELFAAFGRLARAGVAFSTLRGAEERRTLGRDLHERLIRLGRRLYALYIPRSTHGYLTALLEAHPEAPLRLETEGPVRALPWELLHNGEDFLSLLLPLARTPVQMLENPRGFIGSVRRVLLVSPQSDLDQAAGEIGTIYQVLTGELGLQVEVLAGLDASKAELVRALRAGNFDALHYSGHSCHDPDRAGASYLILNGGRKLRADELRRLAQESHLKLVFLNSCASGSTVGWAGEGVAGLADAFVQNGIPSVIGMRWPVSDRGARTLALAFYHELAQSGDPAAALRQARLAVGSDSDWEDPTWAAPLLYLA
ncbi:MAG TPA: CHAT domain-containing protein [Candidatus Fraserbacteria bacterium]|nr:CHAT domain-containing protein [Candidatus Fraserbacteria bacterium]